MTLKMPDPEVETHTIVLLGRRVLVPVGDLLLRCFQHLYGNRISMGRFCWNNECGNCEVRCLLPGETKEHTIRACMYESRAGMRITQVPLEFQVIMQAGEPEEAETTEPQAQEALGEH